MTAILHGLAPRSFAPTIATDSRKDGSVWWLSGECAGGPATGCGTVGFALAAVQQRAMDSSLLLHALPDVEIEAAAAWAAGLLGSVEGCTAVERARDGVLKAAVPRTWVPLDNGPENVLVDDRGGVRFIDLDESFAGPAPLAMAVFARRCRDRCLYAAYERAWSPPLRVDWHSFELTAAVLEAWLGWRRVERNSDRGEVHDVLALSESRLAQRLAAAAGLR